MTVTCGQDTRTGPGGVSRRRRVQTMPGMPAPMPQPITLHTSAPIPAPVSLPDGHVEFVIGDVHGERAHLTALLRFCAEHFPTATCTSLGDVIDRGPDSIGCLVDTLEYARRGRLPGTDIAFFALPGNHEQMLFAPMFNRDYPKIFFRNGGGWLTPWISTPDDRRGALIRAAVSTGLGAEEARSLIDYGISRWRPGADGRPPIAVFRAIGSLLVMHAGIDPTVPDPVAWARAYNPLLLDDEDNPLWVREAFYDAPTPWPGNWFVVHGHTFEHRIPVGPDHVCKEIGDLRPEGHRLGLDAGSSVTGIVAAAAITNGAVRIITARGGGTNLEKKRPHAG
ncbi:hypothetical protein NJLHNGOC_08935 [Novacetimonas cocois]|uniref:Calcineurin-like phosphoesterase domain-containing protein n=2 Tax=Novacetimonas cocois TaxID=1747507 RepID=A0A365YUY6_9PROT|nr:hypothetical protein NJLHNGOC_08935 [Novacetimonas cocois]